MELFCIRAEKYQPNQKNKYLVATCGSRDNNLLSAMQRPRISNNARDMQQLNICC